MAAVTVRLAIVEAVDELLSVLSTDRCDDGGAWGKSKPSAQYSVEVPRRRVAVAPCAIDRKGQKGRLFFVRSAMGEKNEKS